MMGRKKRNSLTRDSESEVGFWVYTSFAERQGSI